MADRSTFPIRALLSAEARDFLGIEEVGGDNRGPAVEWILKGADLSPGEPWCAAFVNRIAEIAFAKKNLPSPLESVPFEGYVQSYYDYGKIHGWLRPEDHDPHPGDLFVVYHASKQRYAHIGFVIDPHSVGGRFLTIEGNSNTDGGRNGYGVVSNQRPYAAKIRFLNPWDET